MKKIITPFFIFCIGATAINCTNDNMEELTLDKGLVEEKLDTTKTISFQNDVLTIIENHCLPCHGKGGSSVNLITYTNFSNNASTALSLIQSGSMPRGGAKLSDNKILTIKTWIDDGKKNN